MRLSGLRFLWYWTNTFSEYCIFLHSKFCFAFYFLGQGLLVHVDQDALQLTEICLSWPPKYWD